MISKKPVAILLKGGQAIILCSYIIVMIVQKDGKKKKASCKTATYIYSRPGIAIQCWQVKINAIKLLGPKFCWIQVMICTIALDLSHIF